jgi:uncharacterized protein with GYD domain
MPKFMYICAYSPGSWARMMRISDDRTEAAKTLVEALGGTLECVFWEVTTQAAYAFADMPDSSTAAAATTVLNHTGAFKNVESHQLLTQDQMTGILRLASDVSEVYRVPGQAAVDEDSPEPRLEYRA